RVAPRKRSLGRAVYEQPRKQPRQDRQGYVRGNREVQHQAVLVAILRDVRDAGPERRRRAAEAHRSSSEPNVASIRLVDAEQDPSDLGPPGADEPGETDDLSGPDTEADVLELVFARQAADLE